MTSTKPPYLSDCPERQRTFPEDWKEAYFRRHFDVKRRGYVCPGCSCGHKVFRGNDGYSQLRADHIEAYANNGKTIWENLQLLCVRCNAAKGKKPLNVTVSSCPGLMPRP